jgi:hypothetical protein
MKYHRYFKAEVDEKGQPMEENIVEIQPPIHYIFLPFFVGVFVGCILMIIF